jgi:hypothetical protein
VSQVDLGVGLMATSRELPEGKQENAAKILSLAKFWFLLLKWAYILSLQKRRLVGNKLESKSRLGQTM